MVKLTKRHIWQSFVIGIFMLANVPVASALELVMFEQESCEWCEVWDSEISKVYPKTPEGKAAPLRRVDIFDPRPADLKGLRKPHFTPTFVLVEKGKEIGRIRGYPGEDFFWGMLGELLKKKNKSTLASKPVKPAS